MPAANMQSYQVRIGFWGVGLVNMTYPIYYVRTVTALFGFPVTVEHGMSLSSTGSHKPPGLPGANREIRKGSQIVPMSAAWPRPLFMHEFDLSIVYGSA